MVAQAYNPSYSGGGDWEDQGLRPDSLGKKFVRTHLNSWALVAYTCNPNL
jgi:hypothetical protein